MEGPKSNHICFKCLRSMRWNTCKLLSTSICEMNHCTSVSSVLLAGSETIEYIQFCYFALYPFIIVLLFCNGRHYDLIFKRIFTYILCWFMNILLRENRFSDLNISCIIDLELITVCQSQTVQTLNKNSAAGWSQTLAFRLPAHPPESLGRTMIAI